MQFQISWPRFYKQWQADLKLWCYFILFQQACRLLFICLLARYLEPATKITTIMYAMIHGARFDFLWATSWLFIALIGITLPSLFYEKALSYATKCRMYLGCIFTVATAALYVASIEYFREYKDIFNQFLFGWFYDDKVAILKTVYAEHYVIQYCLFLLLILVIYVRSARYFTKEKLHSVCRTQYSIAYKAVASVVIVIFYMVGFHGGIGRRSIQLRDAAVTTDSLLNKAIISPYSALRYAIKDHRDINKDACKGFDVSDDGIQKVAQSFFDTTQRHHSLVDYMQKTTNGPMLSKKPRHIFLIVGESLDAWPLQNEYFKFNLTPNLQELIKGGLYFKHFLPCTYNTMESINTIMTGIPDMGLHINNQKGSYFPYPTALAPQFEKLGFKTQFFYGGYLSWQHCENFAYSQGFTAVYGASHIKNWSQTNEWGVDDRALFEFVADTIKKEKQPTFNVIMTTSNHPPFPITLGNEAFHSDKVTKLLAQYRNTNTNTKELGHIWYADKTIGEFTKKAFAIDSDALLVVTGDHYGRRHILPNPSLFDVTAVPLIIYSPRIRQCYFRRKQQIESCIAGSHLDLGATLIELVAPKGFVYYALGDNLLAKRKFNVGIGRDKVITPNFIASTSSQDIMSLTSTQLVPNEIDGAKDRFKQATCIAQYVIKKWDKIYAEKDKHKASK